MKYNWLYLSILLAGLSFFSSCVREDLSECPPLTVKITVKDKNYFNVDKVSFEDRKADDLHYANMSRHYTGYCAKPRPAQ